MEQDCITGLYRSLGMSVGAEFSTEDVRLLYHKVFHVPLNTSEAQAAIKKIAGVDSSWSCVGENVLDVLLEMEKDREQKEMLYWDLQLLNAANLHHMMDYLHQSTDPSIFKKASDSGSLQWCRGETDGPQMGRAAQKRQLCGNMAGMRALKKAGRQCWARLASEGVQSILPPPWQNHKPGIRGQAWGSISLSDILLLVEVKYDVVTRMLYTEMLQEHHTHSVWDTLLPWQQHKEVERMEDLAEGALESVDMLRMAELPGAFRIYKACLGASGSNEDSWSAVSLLNELHTFRQHERDQLTILSEQLCEENLSLLCLHIRLATLRAEREKMSYVALLAARQSWETWPHVNNPCRVEQAALWLHEEEEEDEEDFKTQQPQAVLQLLVLTQEQERKHLVRLVHRVSLEDLQGPGCALSPKEDNNLQTALMNGCIKRLKQIRAQLQTHNVQQVKFQHHLQAQEEWSQSHLENCALLLLTLLTELQEIQAAALLQALTERNAHRVQALREEYESEIQAQRLTNLLRLLISDAPLTSSSIMNHHLNLNENCTNENMAAQSCSGGSPKHQAASSISLNEAQTVDGTDKQDVCSGCGAAMEELPYLEILCVSDPKSNAPENLAAEGAVQEEESSASKSYEKQGSLITLAWSKPAEDEAEAADRGTGQSQDDDTCLETQVQATQYEEKVHEQEPKPIQLQSPSEGHHDAEQVDSGDQEECDLGTPDLGALSIPATKPHGDLCSADSATDGREVTVETCPTESEPWEPSNHEYQNYSPEETFKSLPETRTIRDKDQVRSPVSAVEREKTMRNLVDMQRKVEQKQQRDRERQLLRVQERLSIIQNRKAEEDLLGLKHTERLKHLTQDLPLEDKNQQKTVVRERLEQLRRERSNIMQSKRDRNTSGFKELLGPVAFQSTDAKDGAD